MREQAPKGPEPWRDGLTRAFTAPIGREPLAPLQTGAARLPPVPAAHPARKNCRYEREEAIRTMNGPKRLICLLVGPAIFAVVSLLGAGLLTQPGALAVGTLLWMIFWWVTQPVNLTVTALLPIIVNALFVIVPQSDVISQYFSESIVLVFGSCLLTVPWAKTGLDKRVAYKILSVVGTSLTSQLIVWFIASMLFSAVLPNIAVVALFCPVALAMIKAAGYKSVQDCPAGPPIFLAICWGDVLGGIITPLGGAMNVTAISLLQEATGQEVMYVSWIVRFLPYVITCSILFFAIMMFMFRKVEGLKGSKEFFTTSYRELGAIGRAEAICGILFVLAFVGALCRPLFAEALPSLVPAYIFVGIGMLAFFITVAGEPIMTWDEAQKGVMWGMMYLFAGGLAVGALLNGSGATAVIADIVQSMNFDGGITTILLFAALATILSELTSSTVSSACTIPIVIAFASTAGVNVIPYWLITIMAFDAEFLLPVSIRAVPANYGLLPEHMLKKGLPIFICKFLVVVILGYLLMTFWPGFSAL